MNQRKRLSPQEREEAAAAMRALNPNKKVHVQEWTDIDGKPIIVTFQDF
jgi:hypothetical protein